MPKTTWMALIALLAWLAACYAVRYGLMESQHWVNVCIGAEGPPACRARQVLGVVIHFSVFAWGALALALIATVLGGNRGRRTAWAALAAGLPGLVLYTATPASFALLIAGLRLVRPAR